MRASRSATSSGAPTRAAYVLGAPTDAPAYRFRSGTADAKRYELEIDGRRIVLIAPATTDAAQGHFHTPEQVAMAFAGLPELSRSLTRELVIEPGRNPEDAYWAEQFGDPDMRAYMTAGEGRISVYPTVHGSSQAQLDGSMIHETGHLLADTRFGHDRDSDAWKAWIAAGTRDGIAPSKYATRSPGEDISETLQLWVQVRGTPHEAEIRALFPNRIALLERLLNQP
ncbi:hypothetical protein L6R52_08205 [Myxococcota bacterium]|nr:hypothetical protein [Myxococcota bacterium]